MDQRISMSTHPAAGIAINQVGPQDAGNGLDRENARSLEKYGGFEPSGKPTALSH